MAVVHRTTLRPGKLDLLTTWLPTRQWFTGTTPQLHRGGGFRLDDPAGEVGIECMIVIDTADPARPAYHVPLTYRGAPLPGAEAALVGTSEHGVLGRRWIYDAAADPVAVAQFTALLTGAATAQDQDLSDTPARTVELVTADPQVSLSVRVHRTPAAAPESRRGWALSSWTDAEGAPARGIVLEARENPAPTSAGEESGRS
ncbi:maltokinase N-terminal cap-like domain-containing protein [Nocardia spumae]|uniref:maltokinase N-terminal cap-like domain-containing protein n=1 Tax=Nocardia spumae TaxID=2887190 RepID=UPI001D1329CB|nr:1,4-alpha-glucan branching protein [Nocardia spumae]